jgi:hypothetical protein
LVVRGNGIFTSHNTDEILQVTKGIAETFNPKFAYNPIINAGMKAGIIAAKEDAPKKTHAMERSTDYVMRSPTLFQAFVGVPYGFFQDQGTRYIKATYFFSKNMEAAFTAIQELVEAFHQWQVTHHFKGWHLPSTVNLSGTVSGVSRTQKVTTTLQKRLKPSTRTSLKQRRLKTTTHVSTRLAKRLKRTTRVKTKITPRPSKRKAGK